jgi:hypothetical protein
MLGRGPQKGDCAMKMLLIGIYFIVGLTLPAAAEIDATMRVRRDLDREPPVGTFETRRPVDPDPLWLKDLVWSVLAQREIWRHRKNRSQSGRADMAGQLSARSGRE